MEAKSFLLSKTLWVNLIAIAVMQFGIKELASIEIQEELVVSILAIINIGLRIITKQPLKVA